MGLSTVSQNLNAIWQDYLKHLAFAMRNLNMIIDSPIIISGYLAPYLVPEDLNMLLHLINETHSLSQLINYWSAHMDNILRLLARHCIISTDSYMRELPSDPQGDFP